MDSPLLLPKGIVRNSPYVEGDIERVNREPLDLEDIARFWKVYTTTKRRLLDPTAERLENYWWRIWGSRRRKLQAATVARLFAVISDGQSFVPLRGPANRDEGITSLDGTARHGPGASSTTSIHRPKQSRPNTHTASTTPKPQVIMPPPILKDPNSKTKNRGSSATGPRPTARFISPHESQDESSPISPNSHVVVQPPSPTSQELRADKRTNSSGGKKRGGVVASTGRKRPVIVRRQSSQSSDSGSRATDSSLQSSSDKTPPTFGDGAQERDKQKTSKFQENFSPASERSRRPQSSSRKGRSGDMKHLSPRKAGSQGRQESMAALVVTNNANASFSSAGPSSANLGHQDSQPPDELKTEEFEELELQRLLLAEANSRVQAGPSHVVHPDTGKEGFQILHNSSRSISEGSQYAGGAVKPSKNDNKGTAILAPNLADANGQLELNTTPQSVPLLSKKTDKGKGRDIEESQQSDMFAKRPVQSVSSTSIPDTTGSLARSKSQLTLLLERDRAKTIDKNSKDSKGNRIF